MNRMYLASLQAQAISMAGSDLTVIRVPSTAGGAETSRTLRFMVEELEDTDTPTFKREGAYNVGAAVRKLFICRADTDVREVKDFIVYEGFRWRVVQAVNEPWQGGGLMRMCVGAREKEV